MDLAREALQWLLVAAGLTGFSPSMKAPNDPLASVALKSRHLQASVAPHAIVSQGLFFTYQNLLGSTKGQSRCPMSPSCSEYGRLAVRRYGLARGVLMAGDRLHRCGHDFHLYSTTVENRGVLYQDYPY